MSNCAFNRKGECIALNIKQCEGCAFFKTTEEVNRGRQKALKRVKSLTPTLSRYLCRKYLSRKEAKNGWSE